MAFPPLTYLSSFSGERFFNSYDWENFGKLSLKGTNCTCVTQSEYANKTIRVLKDRPQWKIWFSRIFDIIINPHLFLGDSFGIYIIYAVYPVCHLSYLSQPLDFHWTIKEC